MADCRPFGPQCGLSLIELMLVLFVVGLSSVVVVFSLPPATPDVEKNARALTRSLEMAGQMAILGGQSIGILIDPDGYGFYRRHEGRWQAFESRSLGGGAHRPWPRKQAEDVTLFIERNGQPLAPDSREPQIFFDSTGQASQARIMLASQNMQAEIGIKANGHIALDLQRRNP
ncbi:MULTISPECIES: GspH/FimT family pseudopilin [unclassified Iodidimonas]|jgi:type II secretion system protein H|uniref:GspH/FimT family pseudopilin n=1 Tax=unclassified Iodidimonas TaxID=2626145 RepID=UPI002482D404|nr:MULTISPECIES: GspH/FimT family pseudopilin [unclassified Iodidimonas]